MNTKKLKELLEDIGFAEIRQDAIKAQTDMLAQRLKDMRKKLERLVGEEARKEKDSG